MEKEQLIIIMKNPGVSCNLGCIYCIEEQKNYDSLENKISLEQVRKLARLTKEYSINVIFHGGEPMILEPAYYEDIMNIFEEINDDVYFGMQTNATKIDDKWIEFLKKNSHRLGISVSIDGTRELNKLRTTKTGEPTFDMAFSNIKRLEEENISTGLLCTVVSTSLGKERELYNFITSFDNLKFVKVNACTDRNEDGTIPTWAVTPKQYYNFISNFFDVMLEDGKWKHYIEPIISILKNLQGVRTAYCNFNNEKCTNFLTIYPDGRLTSCDNYYLKHGLIGHLDDLKDIKSAIALETNLDLKCSYKSLLKKCENCEVNDICKGGCIATRERYQDEYCEAMKEMIAHFSEIYMNIIKDKGFEDINV